MRKWIAGAFVLMLGATLSAQPPKPAVRNSEDRARAEPDTDGRTGAQPGRCRDDRRSACV